MAEKEEKIEKSNTALKEEEILAFWTKNRIFEKSLEKNSLEGSLPADRQEFVFYDGPPYATGLPHYGHILPGTIKDVIPRYKTMRGFHVGRRWGWDCHGLPIENLIEKELGLESKKDIVEYGIEKFNEKARESVLRYADDWKETIPRVGRWVDMENDYKTMEPGYMESVMRVFAELYRKGLAKEGYKSMHLCPRCETTLANFEVNQGYKDITDISVYAKFELADDPGTYLLAWTTTPWTLPGNAALAIGEDIEYVAIKKLPQPELVEEGKEITVHKPETWILSREIFENTASKFGEETYTFMGELVKKVNNYSAKDLVGKSYKPLFDYYSSQSDLENKENGWKVYTADFVTTEEGTGIVHIAPAFGEDDMNLGKENNLPFIQHVSTSGEFVSDVKDFAGRKVKPKENHQEADIEIIKYLAHAGKLFAKKKIIHSYPHCWRCDTPLINYASSSWFVTVPEFKDKLVANNEKTNWVPEHVKDGRFGKWLLGARDWAVSRQRFWGSPLPIWRCEECEKVEVLGSVREIQDRMPSSGNSYTVIRHAESPSNVGSYVDSDINSNDGLTEKGILQAKEVAKKLKDEDFDLIIHSPFKRTTETAKIISEELGVSIKEDERIIEIQTGEYEGKSWDEYHKFFSSNRERYFKSPKGGENLTDLNRRVSEFLLDLEATHKDKKILIVSHGLTIIMMHLLADAYHTVNEKLSTDFIKYSHGNAEFRKLDFKAYPHNREFLLDLHRPFIDEVVFDCTDCKGKMKRIEDVFDVWFDSGSMPYGQRHYMFGDREEDKDFENFFPADFIGEGLDQTRGWFYSLMALSTGLFDKPAFKQVVVNGLVLAEDGKKMSKRLKNYPDLSLVLDKYGADALRLFLMSSPAVRAEDVNFSEKGVDEVLKKVMGRLRNVVEFYKLYEDGTEASDESKNVLDRWILARLYETTKEMTDSLEAYEIDRGARPIFDFVDDLSTWYVRRSRDRFKEDGEDKKMALATTRFVLGEFAKLCAPYIPFIAEEVYRAVSDEFESVHLTDWPEVAEIDSSVLQNTATTRDIVSRALERRAESGIKVRQPLSKLTIAEDLSDEYLELIKDEVNVKEVVVGKELSLDTELTDELREEGELRDLIREVQALRKKENLVPSDLVTVVLPEDKKDLVTKFEEEFKKSVSAKEVEFGGELELRK